MSERRDIGTAIASAFSGGQGGTRERRSGHTFAIVMLVVFFVVMMGCLTAGVSIYRSVAGIHAETDALHMETGLLENIVRMNDAADSVQMTAGPEGDALVLVEELDSGTYETRVYLHDGAIVQEYAVAGRPLNPDNAIKIVDSTTFEFSFEDGLLSMLTDDGVFREALRSEQGSARLASAGAGMIAAADAEGAGA